MNDLLAAIKDKLTAAGKSAADIGLPAVIALDFGAARGLADFVRQSGYDKLVLVTDPSCLEAAGQAVLPVLKQAGIPSSTVILHPNAAGDVVADEASVVQVLLEIQRQSADACVALGSGTVHDIVRYAAYTSRIPFLSVPTAPSVDGFTSKGAPLIIRGDKITVPAVGPAAIFADLDILSAAPAAMVAAGFGDMLGKYTSLFDWRFGSLTTGEPFDPFVCEMTERALTSCVNNADEIGRCTPEGVAVLMQALIESGIAMLILGQSHPASGAEHHLSHYWEMDFIRTGRRQLLHGAKVGVACAIIADTYKRIADEGLPWTGDQEQARDRIQTEKHVRDQAPAQDSGHALLRDQPNPGSISAPHAAIEAAIAHWPTILRMIAALPDAQTIRSLLRTVHGPVDIAGLGIDSSLRDRALQEADNVRPGRTTLLRVYNTALRERIKAQ